MGNLLAIVVHAANKHDTKSGVHTAKLAYEKLTTIDKFCGDDGYRNSFEVDVSWEFDLHVDISERIAPKFVVIPSAGLLSVLSLGWAIPVVCQRIPKS